MPRISAASLEEHHDRVWSALVDALNASLAAKPYDRISLAEIAATAGIARNTIYNYARDKAALMAAATTHSAKTLISDLVAIAGDGRSPPQRLRDLVGATLTWVSTGKHRAIIGQAIFASPQMTLGAEDLSAEVLAIVQRVVDEGIGAGLFRPDTALTLDLLRGVFERGARRVYHRPDELELVKEESIRLLLAGLACP